MRAGPIVIAAGLLLSGCLLLGESFNSVDLYNPVTHEQASCGPGPQRGSPSREAMAQMDRCVADLTAKGFRPMVNGDLAPLPPSH